MVIAPRAIADGECGPSGPPPHAASKDVSAIDGQPATLWISDTVVGISTAQGYGEAAIHTPNPLQRSALLVDAQQDGNHQIIVDTGREASSTQCLAAPSPRLSTSRAIFFRFDIGHRHDVGDGIGRSDLGDGPHLVQLLQHRDEPDKPLPPLRRGRWSGRRR
ncbi:MAG: hypothetical protein QOC69_5773 [Mycobacterium sp.]|nr:hypothetical protein [Mycobacterium sp.]